MEDITLLDKRKSLILKGGILLMLAHHLFYNEWSRELYDDITFHGVGLVNQIGIFSKLCVAIFVFVSGYGLAASTPNEINLKDFYLHRFKKLYLNYWFIWLLFVPISVFVFGRTLSDAYGDNVVVKAILDFLGILKLFGIEHYNPTWWFYSCIILLYLLFPLLNRMLKTSAYFILSIAVSLGIVVVFIPSVIVVSGFLLAFVLGMVMAKVPPKYFDKTTLWQIVVALGVLALWRFPRTSSKNVADAMICVGLTLFLYKEPMKNTIGKVLEELGKHSMNMFLIHTFIFYFWFKDYIYITRNPILIFLSLLVASYLFSIMIEFVKKKIGFYKI